MLLSVGRTASSSAPTGPACSHAPVPTTTAKLTRQVRSREWSDTALEVEDTEDVEAEAKLAVQDVTNVQVTTSQVLIGRDSR